jgi:excisionase family DNA binding protein
MPNASSEPELGFSDARRLTIAQVAELANCHPRTVRRAIAAGRLRAYRLNSGSGGRAAVRLRLADVERWLDGEPIEAPKRRRLTIDDITIGPSITRRR